MGQPQGRRLRALRIVSTLFFNESCFSKVFRETRSPFFQLISKTMLRTCGHVDGGVNRANVLYMIMIMSSTAEVKSTVDVVGRRRNRANKGDRSRNNGSLHLGFCLLRIGVAIGSSDPLNE